MMVTIYIPKKGAGGIEVKEEKGLRRFWQSVKHELRENKWAFIVYSGLRILVIGVMILQIFNRNYQNVFLCILTLILMIMPSVVQATFKVEFPTLLEIIILLFIFAAEILGEIRAYYTLFPHWDMMLHTLNGFLCAAVGFCLVDLFDREERFSLQLSPVFMSIVAFCFSMTIGIFWEFFEYTMDNVLLFDMQKDTVLNTIATVNLDPLQGTHPVVIRNISDVIIVADGQEIALGLGGYLDIGLWDTMEDLFVNFIGAFVFSVIGYFYVKGRGKGQFASHFIPKILNEEDSQ